MGGGRGGNEKGGRGGNRKGGNGRERIERERRERLLLSLSLTTQLISDDPSS